MPQPPVRMIRQRKVGSRDTGQKIFRKAREMPARRIRSIRGIAHHTNNVIPLLLTYQPFICQWRFNYLRWLYFLDIEFAGSVAIVMAILFIVALCSMNLAYAQITFLFPSTTTNATKPTTTVVYVVLLMLRKNASIRATRCPLTRDEVLLIKKLGYHRWNQLKDAGKRWIAEIIFSSIKRVFGEDLLSKKFCSQKVEVGLKVMLYTKFISL